MGPSGAPHFRAVSPDALAAELVALCLRVEQHGPALRVLLDGADAARPAELAAAVAELLRAAGRPCAVVDLRWWLRPASLRLEHGRTDADSYRDEWFDLAALRREVLDPLGPGGTGQWLPTLWDPATDRATRAARLRCGEGQVVLVAGPMLLGRGLPAELAVHLHLSEASLRRRVTDELAWTVPALVAHERDADSDAVADAVVRTDHPDRPALLVR